MLFRSITEAVHALIVDAQLTELRATEEIHQRFTALSVEGAEPAEVLRQVAELSGSAVVLENLSRQVLAYDPAGGSAALLLDGWESHSRRIRVPSRTGFDPDSGWLVTTVGARGQDWGRLLLHVRTDPANRLCILLERAASTLALGRLIRRDAEGLERQLHATLLTALLDHSRPVDEVALRARALGVALERRHLVGVVVRPRHDGGPVPAVAEQAELRGLAEGAGQALREANLSGLSSLLDDHAVGALIALRGPADEEGALSTFATALRRSRPESAPVIVAAGTGVADLREARRSLVEARQVADAARHDHRQVPVFRLPHVGLAGLLHLLRDEPRLQTFVERQLGPVLAHDAQHPKDVLLPTLRVYLEQGRNKSSAAAEAHLSRPAFYERLARLGRILQADLDSVEVCLSLHVALLALDAVRDS